MIGIINEKEFLAFIMPHTMHRSLYVHQCYHRVIVLDKVIPKVVINAKLRARPKILLDANEKRLAPYPYNDAGIKARAPRG